MFFCEKCKGLLYKGACPKCTAEKLNVKKKEDTKSEENSTEKVSIV